jgi:hypothetical protein
MLISFAEALSAAFLTQATGRCTRPSGANSGSAGRELPQGDGKKGS